MSELIEVSEKSTLRREDAAKLLREIADSLERHNELEFVRGGIRHRLAVADQVDIEIEIEVGDDGNELEIEITW